MLYNDVDSFPRLAVRFLLETSDALGEDDGGAEFEFEFEPFNAKGSRNDYEVRADRTARGFMLSCSLNQIPWALRGVMSDPRCQQLFGQEFENNHVVLAERQIRLGGLDELRDEGWPVVWPFLLQNLCKYVVKGGEGR